MSALQFCSSRTMPGALGTHPGPSSVCHRVEKWSQQEKKMPRESVSLRPLKITKTGASNQVSDSPALSREPRGKARNPVQVPARLQSSQASSHHRGRVPSAPVHFSL